MGRPRRPDQIPLAAQLRTHSRTKITGPFVLAQLGVHGFRRTDPFELLVPPGRRPGALDVPTRTDPTARLLGPRDPGAKVFLDWFDDGDLVPESQPERRLGALLSDFDPRPTRRCPSCATASTGSGAGFASA
ncbi:MAG: hypothetical protein ACR2MA_01680 [Egibacteraceae bacterium]